jgi:CHAT domain-containing protein/tetratricopeptide (TPR) repeat protein
MLLSLSMRASAAADPLQLRCPAQSATSLVLPAREAVVIEARTDAAGWLEIEEQGADVALDPPGAIEITVPPRYGRWFVPLGSAVSSTQVKRATVASTPAGLRVRLVCADSLRALERLAWFGRAAAVSHELMPVPAITKVEATLARIDALETTATDADQRGLAVHLRAQTLYTVARTSESIGAFAAAEQSWHAAGDSSRALSARIGRIEELIRAARHGDALALAQATTRGESTDGYLLLRATSATCLTQRYLGALAVAADCYGRVEAAFRANDERVDVASTAQDLADVLRYLGRIDDAQQHLSAVHKFADGPYAPQVRGRAYLLESDLRLARGDVLAALNALRLAQSEFETVKAMRWQANTMLRTATLYSQLGVVDEAFALADAALALLPEKDAPARFAAAQVTLARIHFRLGQTSEAMQSAQIAATVYSRLSMPAERDVTHELLARLHLDAGQVDQAARLLADRTPSTLDPPSWELVAARIALEQGKLADARRRLTNMGRQRLSLTLQIELAGLDALWQARSGEPEVAQRMLREAATDIRAASHKVGNPLLQELLIRQIAPLRARSVALLLEELTSSSGKSDAKANARRVDTAWAWAALMSGADRSVPQVRDAAEKEAASRYDELVAAELLAPASGPAKSQSLATSRELLNLLSKSRSSKPLAQESTLRQDSLALRAALAPDAVLLIYLEAQPRGVLLWLTRDTATLAVGPSSDDLRTSTAQLIELVSDRTSAVGDIRRAGDSLAALVLASAPPSPPPSTLLIDGSSSLAAIPWPLLSWPGDSSLLVERSDVSLVRLHLPCCRAAASGVSNLQVLVAPQRHNATALLPLLPSATTEPLLIAEAVGSRNVHVNVGTASGREVVLQALGRPGGWVHIAAHGTSSESGAGYSGIWLEPASSSAKPEFLGALDVLGNGIDSELVVLNACQLARETSDSVRPNLNFANVAVAAGARNVVAALWPISDSATATWVPAFYRHATENPSPDIAGALRTAQNRLRGSPVFRHPFYWASIVHIRTL